MKYTIIKFAVLLGIIAMSIVSPESLLAGSEDQPKVVYLDLEGCEVCQAVKDHGVLTGLEDEGVEVIVYDVVDDPVISDKYAQAYDVHGGRAAPIIFAGDSFYRGDEAINDAYDSGEISNNATEPLKNVEEYDVSDYSFLAGLVLIIFAGLLDGINPCAIAMLLMFISLIGFTKNRKKMLVVSFSYILSVLVTYFLIGMGLLSIIGISRRAFSNMSVILYGFFAILTFVLAVVTFYDFLVTRNDDYAKVKNQLPAFIRRFNKKIMKNLTDVLENKHTTKKSIVWLIAIPTVIGIIVGVTEAVCTGQIYIAVLASIEANNTGAGLSITRLIYLIVFNIMFVVPLIIIAIVAIRMRNTMVVANFMREHLSLTKILTAFFFLIMAAYFVLMAFGISIFEIDVNFL